LQWCAGGIATKGGGHPHLTQARRPLWLPQASDIVAATSMTCIVMAAHDAMLNCSYADYNSDSKSDCKSYDRTNWESDIQPN
jgi:hypothetical protein